MKLRMMLMAGLIAALGFSTAATPSLADVLAERLPVDTNQSIEFGASNTANSQNFLTEIDLSSVSSLTMFGIITGNGYASPGTPVVFKLAPDGGGEPNVASLTTYDTTIVSTTAFNYSTDLVTASLPSITLQAGLYWVGLSGDSNELGWYSYDLGDGTSPAYQWQLDGNQLEDHPDIGTLAYRLDGVSVSVPAAPEPSAWALMIAGVGVIGATLRLGRRRGWAVA